MNEFWNAFTREKTDQQYNPTLWTPRLPADQLLPKHIELTTASSASYRDTIGQGHSTLNYNVNSSELSGEMDLFHPSHVPQQAPIVVYIHGGWWQWFSKEQFSFLAEPFNDAGIAVYMPGYTLAQEWTCDQPMEQILKQLRWAMVDIFKQAQEKQSAGIYLVGHSAGGHLAAALQQTNWGQYGVTDQTQALLKGVFSLAGLFDIRPLVDSFVNDEINMTMDSARAISPQLTEISHPIPTCPMHLIVPEHDSPEFFRQAKEYQHKLISAGQPCHFTIAGNRDHLDIIEKMSQNQDDVLSYILQAIAA